jgi:hypothetical protein
MVVARLPCRILSGLRLALILLLAPGAVAGQYLTRPQVPWRTLPTEHFDIHYPAEMQEWTHAVATRLESVAAAVNGVVGSAPARRVTVMVEDPTNVSNGFALPLLGGPVIFLYPTPPSPSPTFGDHRGWGEILAVHEYAHVAHLSFPSRNRWDRFLWHLLPEQLSPLARRAPAWVIEGYATLIEGELTGSGRPSSVGRAAVMRQWALDGRFPTYGQLNAAGTFLGGNMRYLVGSAYLEWLQQRKGDSSLVHLWRRLSARQQRSFEEAFAGVFGAPPSDLYGAFVVDVMQKALDARELLRNAGLLEGELFQRLSGQTGDPSVSPDGERMAIVVRRLNGPSRLVVWNTAPPDDTELSRARQRLLERDPLDVLPVDSFPRPRRAIATLHPAHGRSHEHPRWMPDGVNVLVSRDEPTADGVMRPDLFLWNSARGGVRRVTHGASIRQADPAPGGRQAAGVRCHVGICSLVLVDLLDGRWRELVAGSPDTVWHRPRWSPDGTAIAASYQANGEWSVAVVDARTGAVRRVDPGGDVSRYAPSWLPSGRELVVVSERGGIANLALVSVDGGWDRVLTRVVGSVGAPEVSRVDSSVFFLSLRSGGLDLRRLPSAAGVVAAVVALGDSLAPVARPVPPSGREFPVQPVGPARGYGLGPRPWRVLPGGTHGPDGTSASLMVANIDPISRLSVVAQGGSGSAGTWRGGSLWAAYRGLPVAVEMSGWLVDQEPPERDGGPSAPAVDALRYRGAGVIARIGREAGLAGYAIRAGGTVGRVRTAHLDGVERRMVSGEARARLTLGFGQTTVNVGGGLLLNTGKTAGQDFSRVIGSGTVTVGSARRYLRGDWWRGITDEAAPGEPGRVFEAFVVGGMTPPYVDAAFLPQRVALPSVPSGFVSGRRFEMYRASIGGPGWSPYFTWVAAGDDLDGVKRIAGIEQEFAFRSMGFVTMPAVRMRLGAGYSFDPPFAYRTRAYASLTYSP